MFGKNNGSRIAYLKTIGGLENNIMLFRNNLSNDKNECKK